MYCLPLYPTDGTLRHRVCFPKPQRAIAAIQGKPSVHWHSFEHASHTTSHGLQQKNVDFSQSFYSSVAWLDLIGSGPLYFGLLRNSLFTRRIWSRTHFREVDAILDVETKLNEEFYSKPLRIQDESHRLKSSRSNSEIDKDPVTAARKGLNIPAILQNAFEFIYVNLSELTSPPITCWMSPFGGRSPSWSPVEIVTTNEAAERDNDGMHVLSYSEMHMWQKRTSKEPRRRSTVSALQPKKRFSEISIVLADTRGLQLTCCFSLQICLSVRQSSKSSRLRGVKQENCAWKWLLK